MAASFLAGLSEANVVIAQGAIADTASREDRERLFGYVYLSASLAYVVGPLGGGKLADRSLASWFSYQTPYWAVAILLLVMLFGVMLGSTALALAVCLPSSAALSLAADDNVQGRVMGNNQSMQVGAESLSGLVGGGLAAAAIKLPLLVFAAAAVFGGLALTRVRPRELRAPPARDVSPSAPPP